MRKTRRKTATRELQAIPSTHRSLHIGNKKVQRRRSISSFVAARRRFATRRPKNVSQLSVAMSRAILLIVVLCQPLAVPSQSLIEEALTGLLGRTAKMGRNFADLARGQQQQQHTSSSGFLQGLVDPQQQKSAAGIILKPQDGTVIGGLFRGFMKDVDDNGKVNTASLLHPDQHQVVGALFGGLAAGRASTPKPTPPPDPEQEILGVLESIAKRRRAQPKAAAVMSPPASAAPVPAVLSAPAPAPATAPSPSAPGVLSAAATLPPQPGLAMTPTDGDELHVVPDVLDEFRRDVQRDAPECSQMAKAQLSKVLMNFRKGVLDCVGVEDADLGDVLTRLRQVLLTADRLPSTLMHNLRRCSAVYATAGPKNATSASTTTSAMRIPPRRKPGTQGNPGEVSAARCILQALADARDHLQKIPTEAAAFSRRVAFLLAGTKSDARVRACVASQLTSMAHPIVATTRQMAGCVIVGPEFSTE